MPTNVANFGGVYYATAYHLFGDRIVVQGTHHADLPGVRRWLTANGYSRDGALLTPEDGTAAGFYVKPYYADGYYRVDPAANTAAWDGGARFGDPTPVTDRASFRPSGPAADDGSRVPRRAVGVHFGRHRHGPRRRLNGWRPGGQPTAGRGSTVCPPTARRPPRKVLSMSLPDRPHNTESTRWRRLSRVLEVRERWRVFCDERARRLNAPGPAGEPLPPESVAVRRTGPGEAVAVLH